MISARNDSVFFFLEKIPYLLCIIWNRCFTLFYLLAFLFFFFLISYFFFVMHIWVISFFITVDFAAIKVEIIGYFLTYTFIFFDCNPRPRVAGSWTILIFSCLSTLHIDFHYACINLHSHHQWSGVTFSAHVRKQVLLAGFWIHAKLPSMCFLLVVPKELGSMGIFHLVY